MLVIVKENDDMVIDSVCDSAVSAQIMKCDEYSTKNPSSFLMQC